MHSTSGIVCILDGGLAFRKNQRKISQYFPKRILLKENKNNWALWLGALLLISACVLAYLITKPAEADVSSIQNTFLA
jgi:hypothetical protein